MSGFSSFFSSVSANAKQMAAQAAESVKPMADAVKAQAASIDTSKVRDAAGQFGHQASEALSQARMAAEPQITQAKELAAKQAKNLSKVNAKSLLNHNASFGVPIDAVAYRDVSGESSAETPPSLEYRDVSGESRPQARVPAILEKILLYLEQDPHFTDPASVSQRSERLFMNRPNGQVVKSVAKGLDQGLGDVDLAAIGDVHVVAALLRQWLAELPEPLLTFALYDHFVNASRKESPVAALAAVAAELPEANKITAARLMTFLAALAAKDPDSIPHLAISFGPALLRPKRREGALRGVLEDLPLIIDVAEVLIKNGSDIFKNAPASPQVWAGVDAPPGGEAITQDEPE